MRLNSQRFLSHFGFVQPDNAREIGSLWLEVMVVVNRKAKLAEVLDDPAGDVARVD